MNMQHAENHTGKPVFRLIVLQGLGRGKKINLETGRQYLVGRAEECNIQIDMSDKTVSRRHAQLVVTDKHIVIENLSATNPVLIKGKPVKKMTLKDKGQFRVGDSLFAVEKTGKTLPADSGKTIPPLRIALIALLVVICGGVLLLLGTDSNPPDNPDITMTKSSLDELPPLPETSPDKVAAGNTFSTTGLNVSSEDMKKADQHFRQGMFFYDTGNISRAVDEWNQAVIFYPDHADAQTWFLRAERELEEKVKTHYQNAQLHYKYMRYSDAAHEFRLVVELSRDKNSDQYINALKSLNEIQGR
ncbi:MAG: FHA domain-containing protein [Desulfobacteraceae bacterium]|jgi:pSer/pThr/pTyr-binding forkhead associated (FHA) protein|nr:FHA domain-containing protein [Desulfobacteraceae bacterium]